jgi:hypothetical protein
VLSGAARQLGPHAGKNAELIAARERQPFTYAHILEGRSWKAAQGGVSIA